MHSSDCECTCISCTPRSYLPKNINFVLQCSRADFLTFFFFACFRHYYTSVDALSPISRDIIYVRWRDTQNGVETFFERSKWTRVKGLPIIGGSTSTNFGTAVVLFLFWFLTRAKLHSAQCVAFTCWLKKRIVALESKNRAFGDIWPLFQDPVRSLEIFVCSGLTLYQRRRFVPNFQRYCKLIQCIKWCLKLFWALKIEWVKGLPVVGKSSAIILGASCVCLFFFWIRAESHRA